MRKACYDFWSRLCSQNKICPFVVCTPGLFSVFFLDLWFLSPPRDLRALIRSKTLRALWPEERPRPSGLIL